MNISITIDGPLTPEEKAILLAIGGGAPESAPEPKAKPEPKAEEPDVEPEDEASTVEKAVARAAELLQSGKVSVVRSVLEEIGVSRVSQLSPKDATTFLEKVEDE